MFMKLTSGPCDFQFTAVTTDLSFVYFFFSPLTFYNISGSALKPSTPTEDQMVLEDTNEGETVAGRGNSTIHFSSCLDQEEIQTKRNHHPSKHRGQTCHIIGTVRTKNLFHHTDIELI